MKVGTIKKLTAIGIIVWLMQISIAAGISAIPLAAANNPAPEDQTFDVGKYLKAPGQQTNKYTTKDGGGAVGFVTKAINVLSQLVGVAAILVLILSGLLMITSGGDENQLSKGKDGFKYAIIGLILAFTGYLIVTFIQAIFYA